MLKFEKKNQNKIDKHDLFNAAIEKSQVEIKRLEQMRVVVHKE